MIYTSLEEFDPEIHNLIKKEEERQTYGLELIASENFASISVLQAGSSILCNKYSEGQVGLRYYGGNEYIDKIEEICKIRALELYGLDKEIWDVNVQVLSGSGANLAAYLGAIGKDGKIMGLDLPSGGHLTHGYKTPSKKISASSIFFESKAYKCKDGVIDYDKLEMDALEFKPDLIVCGGSAYPLDFDYERLRKIAGDKYLMMDMAHISGFIATGIMKNAFDYCDIVTTTTHKLLRGPRAAMIFYKKIKSIKNSEGILEQINLKSKIDFAVFPGLQGGPHNQKIAALAVALKQASTLEYKNYCSQVHKNALAAVNQFKNLGYEIYSDKTECHLILLILKGVMGIEVERICELANISVNKNCISTDKSPWNPSAIRIGTPALTTRGFLEDDFVEVTNFIHEAVLIAKDLAEKSKNGNKLDLEKLTNLAKKDERVLQLKKKVIEKSKKFPFPVFDYTKK